MGVRFGAPALVSFTTLNNPIALGNPNLVPALNDTYEFGASWKPQDNLQLQGNVFYYKLHNMIGVCAKR